MMSDTQIFAEEKSISNFSKNSQVKFAWMLSYRLKRNSRLVATTESTTIADGEADGFATTNETASPRYPLWSK